MKLEQITKAVKPVLDSIGPVLEKISKKIPPSVLEFIQSKPKEVPAGPSRVLACDLGSSSITFLEMVCTETSKKVSHYLRVPRPKGEKDLATLIKTSLEQGGFESNRIRIALKGQGVVVRFIRFPQMKTEELRGALTFEAENYIPFRTDEVILDFHVLDENVQTEKGVEMSLILIAVRREEIYNVMAHYQGAGLELDLIDVDVIASLNALEFLHPNEFSTPVAYLDIGTEISSLSVLSEGKPRFIRDISYGAVDIAKRLKRRLGLSEEDAFKVLNPDAAAPEETEQVLKEAYESLVTDLKVSFDYYLDQVASAEPVKTIFIGGGGSLHPLVQQVLSEKLNVKVMTLDFDGKVEFDAGVDQDAVKKNQALLSVALGLCVRGQ